VNLIGPEPSRERAPFRSPARKIFSGLHVCLALDFFHIFSAAILIVDSICATVTTFFSGLFLQDSSDGIRQHMVDSSQGNV
jgi:hypothetical protein